MMTKRFSLLLGLTLLSVWSGPLTAAEVSQPTASVSRAGGSANWISTAYTVRDQLNEADVVVRARVVKVNDARELRVPVPVRTPDGKDLGTVVDVLPFTDSDLEVLEVYKGSPASHIVVMQTGGVVPAKGGRAGISVITEDDPILFAGSEYILFLKDISDDPVHAQGRMLYRAVNPAGRYRVAGTEVASPYGFPPGFAPPKTLSELVDRIQRARTVDGTSRPQQQ